MKTVCGGGVRRRLGERERDRERDRLREWTNTGACV